MEDYNFYLFSRLILGAGLVSDQLEYDLSFDEIVELYYSFEGSVFDDADKDLYGCILEFIQWKQFVNAE